MLVDNVSVVRPVCVYGRVSAMQRMLVEIDYPHPSG